MLASLHNSKIKFTGSGVVAGPNLMGYEKRVAGNLSLHCYSSSLLGGADGT